MRQKFFLFPVVLMGFVSCAGNSGEVASSKVEAEQDTGGANQVTLGKDSNPYAYQSGDVNQTDSSAIAGGKRSQYDQKKESAYAKANGSLPNYLQQDYQKKAWAGGKDYRTGSYQAGSSSETGRKSWFSDRKSREANKISRNSGQDYSTGSYRTNSSRESARSYQTGSNGYAESRNQDGWGRSPVIFSEGEYRSMTMGQAKSLLGR